MSSSAEKLLGRLDQGPLSDVLGKALRVAQVSGATEIARWCRLELGGYLASNPAMGDDIVVPEYRTVAGQHADIFGRVLVLSPELAFVGETRLRNGVEELEVLARTRDIVAIHDPHMCQLIREHLQVEVYSFRFSAVHVAGILSAIRMELSEKLLALKVIEMSREPSAVVEQDEIIALRPNFYGIGVDLRALWRRWKGPQ